MNPNLFSSLSAVPGIDLVADELIQHCPTFTQALGIARALSRKSISDGDLAETLGMQASVWSRIQRKPANSPAYMPEDKFAPLCRTLGNAAVLQWLAARIGFRLVPITETDRKRAALLQQLANLEQSACA
jgi:hypothetical protein